MHLSRLAWLDKAQLNSRFLTPEKHGLAGKPSAVIVNNSAGCSTASMSWFRKRVTLGGEVNTDALLS